MEKNLQQKGNNRQKIRTANTWKMTITTITEGENKEEKNVYNNDNNYKKGAGLEL